VVDAAEQVQECSNEGKMFCSWKARTTVMHHGDAWSSASTCRRYLFAERRSARSARWPGLVVHREPWFTGRGGEGSAGESVDVAVEMGLVGVTAVGRHLRG
jgi:hypothetical protein